MKRKLEDVPLKLSPTGENKNEHENKYLRQMLGDIKKLGEIIEIAKSGSGRDRTRKDIRDLIGKVCRTSLLVEQRIYLSVCEVRSERKYEKLEQDIDLRTTLEEERKKSKELSEREETEKARDEGIEKILATRFPEIGELEEIEGRREIKITREYVSGGELKTKQTYITEMKEGKDMNETIEIQRNWKDSIVRNQRKNLAMACHGEISSEQLRRIVECIFVERSVLVTILKKNAHGQMSCKKKPPKENRERTGEKDKVRELIRKRFVGKGWDRWNVEEIIDPIECNKCKEYGHKANDCKNQKKEERCYNCAEGGHVKKDCKTTTSATNADKKAQGRKNELSQV
ncbi:hypothetical protein HHI36_023707 [Cryptolaemus montrouzieri]|uniref:CCHC-type domain-containing protein n=1 Tax=Cryptolaemus montrouzieri TaxID=559131 RepID=A0ABD2PI70_9CUCU